MAHDDPIRSRRPLKPVALMTADEKRAEIVRVADLLHEFRFFADDARIFLLMPLLLRQVDRGETLPPDGKLEAPEDEFAEWLHDFVYYLFAAANLPDVRPHSCEDARWALAQIGVPTSAIDAVGRSGRLQQPAIEQLIARLLVESPWTASATDPRDARADAAPRRRPAGKVVPMRRRRRS